MLQGEDGQSGRLTRHRVVLLVVVCPGLPSFPTTFLCPPCCPSSCIHPPSPPRPAPPLTSVLWEWVVASKNPLPPPNLRSPPRQKDKPQAVVGCLSAPHRSATTSAFQRSRLVRVPQKTTTNLLSPRLPSSHSTLTHPSPLTLCDEPYSPTGTSPSVRPASQNPPQPTRRLSNNGSLCRTIDGRAAPQRCTTTTTADHQATRAIRTPSTPLHSASAADRDQRPAPSRQQQLQQP